MATVLVIDDDSGVSRALAMLLGREGHRALAASSAEEGLELAERERPAAVFMDVRLPGMSGLEALVRMRALLPDSPVMVMTGHGTLSTAVEAVRKGAFDYLSKPLSVETARAALNRALAQGAARSALDGARQDLADFPPETLLVGRSAAMQALYRQLAAAAAADATVLLSGESGTGKELAARAIHLHSARGSGPFVAVNCAGLPETLLETELFGHVRGAFTGAVANRTGRVEAADGGTLFLDEVGEMSPGMQAKLLRFLESRTFERLGESEPRRADVRVISATNRDLAAAVRAGAFREDLFYRLDVLRIVLPPLRERREDVPLLVAHFLSGSGNRAGRPTEISREALSALEAHDWPGNVRELRNCLDRAAALAGTGGTVGVEHLPPGMAGSGGPGGLPGSIDALARRLACEMLAAHRAGPDPSGDGTIHAEAVRLAERAVIAEVLAAVGGNQVQAARELGLHRTTLRKKIEEYGLPSGREEERTAQP
ncbi:MAG TPA: sigma-54 dependent transcriptional regulator [Planctomycetota bacterium]|nr:sigma-54 dependent transcriptional regulator [Planctomycetota bacterium]